MEIDVFCIAPDEEIFANIRTNSASCRKWVKSIPAHDGHAVLVGGGPSLRETFPEIKRRQELGQSVFALNGAAGFLNCQDIIPDYQVLLDPQPVVARLIASANDYLVASQCHPAVLIAVSDATLWHLAVDGAEQQLPEFDEAFCLVGGGFTVGLSSMCLAYAMGYRKLHLYGYDSSAADDADHAYPGLQAQLFHADNQCVATIDGKTFRTTFTFAKQALAFPKLCGDLTDRGCLITVNSGGLIMAVIDDMNNQSRKAMQ